MRAEKKLKEMLSMMRNTFFPGKQFDFLIERENGH